MQAESELSSDATRASCGYHPERRDLRTASRYLKIASQQRESAQKAQGEGRRFRNKRTLHHAKGVERFRAGLEAQVVNLQVWSAITGGWVDPNAIAAVITRIRLRAGPKLQPSTAIILRILEILMAPPCAWARTPRSRSPTS